MNFAHESGDAFVSVYFARCTITATFCQVWGSWRNSFPVPGWSDLAKSELAGKSKPLNFLLDSGAGISAIDLRTARTLGVLLGSRQTVLGVNGQGFAFQVSDLHGTGKNLGVHAATAWIGDDSEGNHPTRAVDMRWPSRYCLP